MTAVTQERPDAPETLVKNGKVSIYQPEQEGLIFPDCLFSEVTQRIGST